ncbi:hypothetical protein BGX27_010540, partial [Mortierella sp. AM989]
MNLLLEVKDNNDKILTLQMEVKDKDDKILTLQVESEDNDDKILTLQTEAKEKDDKILTLQIEAKDNNGKILTLQTEAKGKDDKILTLQMEAKDNNDKILTLQTEAKRKDDKILTLQMEAKDNDDKILILQLEAKEKDLQNQARDRLAILQKHAQAILAQKFDLHEYPIPRLFIILPADNTKWNPRNVLENKFRLHFLCECGDHTTNANKTGQDHIHVAKHEGYEIRNSTEFFSKYGKYMFILLQCIKMGVFPSAPLTPTPSLVDADISYSIDYMKALSIENSVLNNINTIDDYEGLGGANLQQLATFLRINDQDRTLGDLYRIVIETGHVKWVEQQKALASAVKVYGGNYDSQLGKVTITLRSKILAERFFEALVKARHVYDLDITFGPYYSSADLEAFENALKMSSVSILRLDLQQFRASNIGKKFPASTQYEILVRMIEQIQSIEANDFRALANSLKTNTTFTTLDLRSNSIGNEEALVLSEALYINTTLTTLNLRDNSIEKEGARALSEALKTNTTLATLDLGNNSIEKEGARALSEALETNTTLAILNL